MFLLTFWWAAVLAKTTLCTCVFQVAYVPAGTLSCVTWLLARDGRAFLVIV